jgi:hypothetical protein
MRGLLIFCFAVVFCEIAWAQEHFDVRGQGVASCGQFANMFRMHPEETDAMFFAWAQGYMSGLNTMAADPQTFFDLNAKTPNEMRHFLRQYCQDHPLADYADGVFELFKTLPTVKRKQ